MRNICDRVLTARRCKRADPGAARCHRGGARRGGVQALVDSSSRSSHSQRVGARTAAGRARHAAAAAAASASDRRGARGGCGHGVHVAGAGAEKAAATDTRKDTGPPAAFRVEMRAAPRPMDVHRQTRHGSSAHGGFTCPQRWLPLAALSRRKQMGLGKQRPSTITECQASSDSASPHGVTQ